MRVDVVGGDAAASYADDVFPLYDKVFGDQPDESVWREERFDRHRSRREYRLALAHDGDRLIGFAWGYRGDRGQYWPDQVARALPDIADDWIGDHFEFVELAVDSAARGQGIGHRLHDALLDSVTGPALLCTTSDDGDPGPRLYRSCGWRRLGLLDPDWQVMGLRLPSAAPYPESHG